VTTPGSGWVKSFYSRHGHSNKSQEGTDLWHIPTAGQPQAIGPAARAPEDAVPLAGTCFHPERSQQHLPCSGWGYPPQQAAAELWAAPGAPGQGATSPPSMPSGAGREQLSSRAPRGNCSVASVPQPSPQHAGAWVGWQPQGCQPAKLRPTSPTGMSQGPRESETPTAHCLAAF